MERWLLPRKNHLAVAFYEDGNLLVKYSVTDLIEDPKSVLRSTGHYEWLSLDGERFPDSTAIRFFDSEKIFYLKTIEGIRYRFDITTGKIVSKEKS